MADRLLMCSSDPLQGNGIIIWGDLAEFSSPDCLITLIPEMRRLCFPLIMVAKVILSLELVCECV